MRIATWNLKGVRQWTQDDLLAQIDRINADIWVLTETNEKTLDLSLTHPYRLSTSPQPADPADSGEAWVSSLPFVKDRSPDERWTMIWSRYEIEPLTTFDPCVSVCGRIRTSLGALIVYGTVLPWCTQKDPLTEEKGWTGFVRVLPLQKEDWKKLRLQYPQDRFCVAGDLNQTLDGRSGSNFGGKEHKEMLLRALSADELKLRCVTRDDLVAAGQLTNKSSVDHICLCAASLVKGWSVGAWEAPIGKNSHDKPTPISDHNGVYVDLRGCGRSTRAATGLGNSRPPKGFRTLDRSLGNPTDGERESGTNPNGNPG
jgi:hypothetical protein